MTSPSFPPGPSGRTGPSRVDAVMFRFGEYEVDPGAEELRKAGVRLHLPSQPFRILCLLLEEPGRLVTREEMRRRLWPDGEPADHDRSLNTAVNRLRVALCDSAGDDARYIETLPRKGYRFAAAAERVDLPAGPAAVSGDEANARPEESLAAAPVRGRRGRMAAAAAVFAALAAGWWIASAVKAPRDLTEVVALTDYPGSETTPGWSPDGREIAFAWNGGGGSNLDIWILKTGAPAPERLTQSMGNEFAPRYSPDGRRIAFYRRAGDSIYIHVVDAERRNMDHFAGFSLKIGPEGPTIESGSGGGSAGEPASLSWSPDGKIIAYVDKTAPERPYGIFFLTVSGRQVQQATWPADGIVGDGAPALSPDGRYLAFVRSRSLSDADIYLATTGGGGARRLTNDGARIRGIAWSRDGRSIIFSSERAGEPSLWRTALSGGPPERLTQAADPAILPALPREGDGLVFARWQAEQRLVRADPREEGSVEAAPAAAWPSGSSTPSISPDGARITFSGPAAGGGGAIWVSGLEGANRVQLTSDGQYSGSPRWSPDGRLIAYDHRARNSFGVYDVYVVDASGGRPRALTRGPQHNSRPSWSGDGKWIYFGSDRSGMLQIWKVRAGGGSAIQVTRKGGSDAEESPDGKTLYYSRRAVGGLWSIPVNGGEEKLALKDLQWENSRNWTVRREGIYFLASEGARFSERRHYLKLFRFSDQRVIRMAGLGAEGILNGGCAISADARRLFYVQIKRTETDLFLWKGFR
ncbi:MAG: winged helix-turn-helix domain-containing protein [Bryobacterales bacterium]|nr:winged helix-turn-helix domain-containing protein [Bryobacterales bacterium]